MSAVDHAEDQFLMAEKQGLLPFFLISVNTECGPLWHYNVVFHDSVNIPSPWMFAKQTQCES